MTAAELRAQAAAGLPLSPAAMKILAHDLERLEAIDARNAENARMFEGVPYQSVRERYGIPRETPLP